MGHYINGICPTHGDIDMDDSLAFCEECREVVDKGELTRLRARVAELERAVAAVKQAVDDFDDLIDEPLPVQRIYRDALRCQQVRKVLAALDAAEGEK